MKRIRSIIVEDNPDNAADLRKKLEENCPQVEIISIATNCKQAIEQINFHRPGLLFLDIKLPDGDGFGVLEKIEDTAIPVIFTTGYMEYEYMKKAVNLSAVDYLEKLIDPVKLIAAVEKATEQRSEKELKMQNQVLVSVANDPSTVPQIVLHSDGKLYFIDPKDIAYASSVKGKEKTIVYICSENGKLSEIPCAMLLKNMAEKLESLPFLLRVSRSEIVNLYKLKMFDKANQNIHLKCGDVIIKLGDSFEDDFFGRLGDLGIL